MRDIKFRKMIPTAITPLRKFDQDAGFDFYATDIIKTPKYTKYLTKIELEIPEGMVGLVFPRSSVINKDLMLKNCVGVIDSTYRGEIMFMFQDTKEYTVTQPKDTYEVGERVAQVVFLDLPSVKLLEVDELSKTERGEGGFGSTGNQ
jgi:dUTP pyrophosphatase